MKFDQFTDLVAGEACFDLAMVAQLSQEPRASLTNQLYRWTSAGKVEPLRRGMYTLAERYRRRPLSAPALANALYRPSYLSGLWALSYYGLIPEAVPRYTCVTTRSPQRFENAFGCFDYRHIKQDFFFGYREVGILQARVLVASPEKALLDVIHLSRGEWTVARIREMRFQQPDQLDADSLELLARRMNKPRILRAVGVWLDSAASDNEGTVAL
jgi:predicted transcriptional regulator of viral defense system